MPLVTLSSFPLLWEKNLNLEPWPPRLCLVFLFNQVSPPLSISHHVSDTLVSFLLPKEHTNPFAFYPEGTSLSCLDNRLILVLQFSSQVSLPKRSFPWLHHARVLPVSFFHCPLMPSIALITGNFYYICLVVVCLHIRNCVSFYPNTPGV